MKINVNLTLVVGMGVPTPEALLRQPELKWNFQIQTFHAFGVLNEFSDVFGCLGTVFGPFRIVFGPFRMTLFLILKISNFNWPGLGPARLAGKGLDGPQPWPIEI